MRVPSMTPGRFRHLVFAHYKQHGRHALPWRKTRDPYKILVSEMMLQQTQVDRVVLFYTAWVKRYPTIQSLAKASLSDVLSSWQGLGYNRRPKMLHQAAKLVVAIHNGKLPKSVKELEQLPGIGPYTARAVAAFAYNQDVVFIETNLRTAVTHHFFPDREKVADAELLPILTKAFPQGNAREWYSALMDYGSYLKRSGVRINHRSTSYTKQKAFRGSNREVRGALLKQLILGPATGISLLKLFPKERVEQTKEQLDALLKEGLIQKAGRFYQLPH
jgi:A/G-specific adenine glycosylase